MGYLSHYTTISLSATDYSNLIPNLCSALAIIFMVNHFTQLDNSQKNFITVQNYQSYAMRQHRWRQCWLDMRPCVVG